MCCIKNQWPNHSQNHPTDPKFTAPVFEVPNSGVFAGHLPSPSPTVRVTQVRPSPSTKNRHATFGYPKKTQESYGLCWGKRSLQVENWSTWKTPRGFPGFNETNLSSPMKGYHIVALGGLPCLGRKKHLHIGSFNKNERLHQLHWVGMP